MDYAFKIHKKILFHHKKTFHFGYADRVLLHGFSVPETKKNHTVVFLKSTLKLVAWCESRLKKNWKLLAAIFGFLYSVFDNLKFSISMKPAIFAAYLFTSQILTAGVTIVVTIGVIGFIFPSVFSDSKFIDSIGSGVFKTLQIVQNESQPEPPAAQPNKPPPVLAPRSEKPISPGNQQNSTPPKPQLQPQSTISARPQTATPPPSLTLGGPQSPTPRQPPPLPVPPAQTARTSTFPTAPTLSAGPVASSPTPSNRPTLAPITPTTTTSIRPSNPPLPVPPQPQPQPIPQPTKPPLPAILSNPPKPPEPGTPSTGAEKLGPDVSLALMQRCPSDEEEIQLKARLLQLLGRKGNQAQCLSGLGRFRFLGQNSLQLFSISVAPAIGRAISNNRCGELRNAIACVEAAS